MKNFFTMAAVKKNPSASNFKMDVWGTSVTVTVTISASFIKDARLQKKGF